MNRLAIALAATVAALATVAPASAQHYGHRQHHSHGHVHRHVQVQHHHVRPTYYGHSYHRPVIVHTPVYEKPKTVEKFCVEIAKDSYGRVWKKQIECKVEHKPVAVVVPVAPPPPAAQEEVPQK